MAKATLVVMAAGMGSRFGGIKQLTPVGANGEVLLDYSVYDALQAGFDKVVFIIKKEIEADFRAIAGDRIARHVEVEYVFQTVPAHRKKPYGTGDAILCTEGVIDSPFAVINADDFYGADAFQQIRRGLDNKDEYCMVVIVLPTPFRITARSPAASAASRTATLRASPSRPPLPVIPISIPTPWCP